MAGQITSGNTRHFTTWLNEQNCLIILSSYSTHHLLTIGLDKKSGETTTWITNMPRSMGLHYSKETKNLIVSNIGNLLVYKDKGPLTNSQFGHFDTNFIPQFAYFSGDVDVHDICETSKGEIFFISALFSCVCKPTKDGSFKPYWLPPWITKYAAEDRCHLNGLCLVDDVPRYVTSACQGDSMGSWRHSGQRGKGIVYDIVEDKIVCSNLWNPHSPRWYRDKLWLMESGTGYFGYVDLEKNEFVNCAFIPAFLRGLDFIDKYAVVAGSLPRHESKDFGDFPLGNEIKEKGLDSDCGIWIVNLDTFDIQHQLFFNTPVKELYDVAIIPNSKRGRVFDLGDSELFNLFYIDPSKVDEKENNE